MSPPDPKTYVPSYGLRCLALGRATDAPLSRWERLGVWIEATADRILTGVATWAAAVLVVVGLRSAGPAP